MSLQSQAVGVAQALCRVFEGFRSRPYLCPAGVPTIGYGATTYLTGTPVKLGDPAITKTEADVMLRQSLERVYVPAAALAVPTANTPERLGALADFAFNLGTTRLRGSTLRRRALAGDWDGVKIELRKWNRGGGRVLPGLDRRRKAEADLV